MNRHLMVDLETLGAINTPTIPIIQVGVVVFTQEKDIREYVSNTRPLLSDVVEFPTLEWWSSTDWSRLGDMLHYAKPLASVLHDMSVIARTHDVQTFWTRGQFDWPILQAKVKQLGIDCPFDFRMARDVRTLEMLYTASTGKLPLKRTDTDVHDALADAKWQAYCTRVYCQQIGVSL